MDLYELYRIVSERTVLCVFHIDQDGQVVMLASAFTKANKPIPGTDFDSWTVKSIRPLAENVLMVEVAR